MDLSAFYAVVSGINFTLLGLWWVAVKDRRLRQCADVLDSSQASSTSIGAL